MFEVRVDLSGLDRLIRNVEDLEAEVTEAMAEEIKRGADAAVPVDTGALKRSGRIEDRKGREGARGRLRDGSCPICARRPLRTWPWSRVPATASHGSKAVGEGRRRRRPQGPAQGDEVVICVGGMGPVRPTPLVGGPLVESPFSESTP